MQRMSKLNLRNVLLLCMTLTLIAPACGQPVTKLLASDGADDDRFGAAIAADGSTVLVGAPGDDAGRGAAYVFHWDSAGGWSQSARLTAGVRESAAAFGQSVALSGEFAIVGAPLEDSVATDAGAVYVFRNIAGVWIPVARIVAPDGARDDRFGSSVSLRGDLLAIGVPLDDDAGSNAGAVVLFRYDGVSWTQEARLHASDAQWNDQFGTSVAVDTDRIVVGAPFDDDGGSDAGAAYVFVRNNDGVWVEEQKLLPDDPASNAQFGASVAASQQTVVVGAPRSRNADQLQSGAVYVFRLQSGSWVQQQKIAPLDLGFQDWFGYSVAIDGTRIVAGAPLNDAQAVDGGATYVFARSGNTWIRERVLLAADAEISDRFGASVTVSGDWVACGAPNDDQIATDAGAAYVFLACGPADLDGDGDVDLGDLTRLLADFGCFGDCVGDVDGDSDTDLSDLSVLLADFGTTCPQ